MTGFRRVLFRSPPIITGITRKKIITKAWAVTITLYNWKSPAKNAAPGDDNSNLIKTLNAAPTQPANAPNKRYKVPISLWLVLNIHRANHDIDRKSVCRERV